MKKTNRYAVRSGVWLGCLALLLALAGCQYEYPSLTSDGQEGVDPTNVTVMANIKADLNWEEGAGISELPDKLTYVHRIVVDAYLGRTLVKRTMLYREIGDDGQIAASISLPLSARNYRLVVWADYIKIATEEHLHYNADNMTLVYNTSPYRGNTVLKDCFYANCNLDLTDYRKQVGVTVPFDIRLHRPVAHYSLVADDVKRFRARLASEGIKDTKFTVRVKYTKFFPTAYNVLDELQKQALQYINYSQVVSLPADAGAKELPIGFDLPLIGTEGNDIPIAVEVIQGKNTLLACTYLLLSCRQGASQTIKSNFLTADPSGGVDIDTGFDDIINDEVTVE